VIHAELLIADQEQPLAVVTPTVPEPPDAGEDCSVAESE